MRVLITIFCFSLAAAYPRGGGPAISNQQSAVQGGDGVTGIAHGVSTANGGRGGAVANQNSKAVGGDGSTLVADGTATANSGLSGGASGLLENYGPRISGGPIRNHFNRNGPSISNQQSQVHGGDGITGIATGTASSQGHGTSIANQHSIATGGAGSTLVADGTANSQAFRKREIPEKSVYTEPGGVRVAVRSASHFFHPSVAISNQESAVHGGYGITGIASGSSNAEGRNGAVSNQHSIATGGGDSTLVANGQSNASTNHVLRSARRHGPSQAGLAIANQDSQAHVKGPGNAEATGGATASSAGGPAIAHQHSGASVAGFGSATAGGFAKANSGPVKRSTSADLTGSSKLLDAAISQLTKNAASNSNVLFAESKAEAKTT